MKLLSLLALGCSIVAVLSESTDSSERALRARALAQLERLAPYRRTPTDQGTTDEQWQLLENSAKDHRIEKLSDQQIFEIYRLLPENLQRDIVDRVGGNRAMIELLANQKYIASMQDRIKRSGSKRQVYNHDGYESPPDDGYPPAEYPPESYGEYEGHPQPSGSDSGAILKGSGSLIGGLAKGIINGLVSASGSASKGSSSVSAQSSQTSAESSAQSSAQTSSSSSNSGEHDKPKPEYGQVYSYSDKAFDVWDFKKAIISTLMQAVKAITGGVIALKGQLLKGGAYLIASKTKLITKTGDAITALGTNIVKNAAHPYAQPPHPGYLYDHHPQVGHEDVYEGPPPSIEEYGESHDGYQGNTNYESSSDVDDQAGLLIVKPTKPDNHDHHTVDLDIRKPAVTHSEGNYYGPPPGLLGKDVENTVTGNTHSYQNSNQDDYNVKPNHQLPSSYDVSIQQHSSNDHVKEQHDYQIYPPLASPFNHHSPLSVQQSVEYPPIHIQYSLPDKGNSEFNGDANSNDLSVYSSVSIDTDPKIESIKISAELPKSQPHIQNFPLLPYSYPLQGPLKIPLLNSYSSPYWQNQGAFQLPYANFNFHGLYRRRSSSQKRRSVSEIAQRMRLQQG
ncbi:uncharacterized protein LOC122527276 [Frieseomelitta varia]|uniref:uncharacterized protein LOC122527276 n=1 Tax=Frieseomelitta varia TaxID=561572 RepID=UPI001CB6AB0F|nr:uncharacterized protein LOC122527276 [Frieseomelitta varia]XP_043507232.1 uncharacterized protein LOC122527276 [Frieseomelitta varia]